ncbi:MAG: beta-lactamase family protein [Pseudomonadales bacterium]|nr:beta-lactamase family protein [Pseudomonadales bacterium]
MPLPRYEKIAACQFTTCPLLMLHRIILFLVCCLFVPLVSGSDQAAAEFAERFESQIILPVAEETPGAAVVAVVDGEVVLQKTWGVRKAGSPEPVTPYTTFRLASISKTFASAAAAILVQESPVSWQTPIVNSVSSLHFKRQDYGKQINLKHLMSQSTGLMPHAYTNLVEERMSFDQIINRLDRVDFICKPGECYGYQNVVFSLVGDVVKANTGVDYATYVQDRIFKPLNMTTASLGREPFVSSSNFAQPHIWTGSEWKPARITPNYYKVLPAAGVNASIDDMKHWLLAQLGHNPDVLSPQMLDEMQSSVIPTTRRQAHYKRRSGLRNTAYGLGWRLFDYQGESGFVHHGGYVKGMRGEMLFNRKLQTGFVFLTNSEPGVINDLVFDFIDLYRDVYESAAGEPAVVVQAGQ